jgi:cytochrome c-type biogenesis protein CcsB
MSAALKDSGFDRIAVQTVGLEKSLATFARDSLRAITLRKHIREDDPIALCLHLIARPGDFADRWLIPVEGDPLMPLLQQAGTAVDNRTLKLGDCLEFDPRTGAIVGEGKAIGVARHAIMTSEEGSLSHSAGMRLFTRINAVIDISTGLRIIPDPDDPEGRWYTVEEAEQIGIPGIDEVHHNLHTVLTAVADGDAAAVSTNAARLVNELRVLPNYASSKRIGIDHAYTTRKPFFWASFAYVLSGVLFFVSLVTHGKRTWFAAMAVMGAGWTVHILGAAARGYLIGRMPLSSLYEATTTGIAFIILIALILEGIYRMRIVGCTSAFLSFIYYRWLLSSEVYGNDAIEPLRAVLNSYWLDYHVTCMMLSYGAFTIAFAMALLYLLRAGVPRLMGWSPSLDDLDLYTYRAIQFGWPLLGIGIVLGAVWADTAWGRMWSWDPKETWSLITWLIYTVFLHVRLVHGWRGRVMAWASIVGYGAVLFTYLGVNFVLSGLHSYAGSSPVMAEGLGGAIRNHWMITLALLAVIVAAAALLRWMHQRHIANQSSAKAVGQA